MPLQRLPVPLSDAELQQKGHALAELEGEHTRIDDERAETSKAFKEALKEIRVRMKTLAKSIRDRTETRQVNVREIQDDRRLTVDFVRSDTGEVIGSRAMTASERQGRLPIPPDPPTPPAPDVVPPGRATTAPISETLEGIAATPVPVPQTEPVLDDEERAAVRQRAEIERAAQLLARQQAEEVARAFAPAPPAPPRVPRPAPLAAEQIQVDGEERRFSLVLDELARDEPTKPASTPETPSPSAG